MGILCEMMVKEYVPMLRSAVSQTLVKEYGFTQLQVASSLGITQAAVSKYLSSTKKISDKGTEDVIKSMGAALAAKIAGKNKQHSGNIDSLVSFCKVCYYRNSSMNVCSINKKELESSNLV